jgi:hypothetical protein
VRVAARSGGARFTAITVCLFISVVVLVGQSVVDPRVAEFDPSPDHDAVTSSGQAIVQSYLLELYRVGESVPFRSVSLGKPAPATDGKIRVDLVSVLGTLPAGGVNYEARVSAIGPGGSAASGTSNPFSFTSTCAPSISPSSRTLTAAGGTGSVTVTAAAGCGWTAASAAGWMAITGGGSGSGNGTVTYSVGVNTTSSQRTGTLNIAGQTFTVTQAGASCTPTVSPTVLSLPHGGGSGSITVTAACAWTATASANWIVLTGTSGTGTGAVAYQIGPNNTAQSRSGTITIGGRVVNVSQAPRQAPGTPRNLRVAGRTGG